MLLQRGTGVLCSHRRARHQRRISWLFRQPSPLLVSHLPFKASLLSLFFFVLLLLACLVQVIRIWHLLCEGGWRGEEGRGEAAPFLPGLMGPKPQHSMHMYNKVVAKVFAHESRTLVAMQGPAYLEQEGSGPCRPMCPLNLLPKGCSSEIPRPFAHDESTLPCLDTAICNINRPPVDPLRKIRGDITHTMVCATGFASGMER